MIGEEEFMREVSACERTLYRVSRALLGSDADCADAVQEALLKAWRHRGRTDISYFRAWLTRIVINECRTIGRRRARTPAAQGELPDVPTPQRDVSLETRDALERLSAAHRLVLTLHYLEGFSLAEIAKLTRVPLGTVKYRIVQARKALRRELEEDGNRRGGAHL